MTPAAIARFFLYLGATLVVGELSQTWARREHPRLGKRPRTGSLLSLTAWPLLLCATLALALLQALDMELDATFASTRMLLTQTTWGRGWSVLAVAVLAGAIASAARAPRWLSGLFVLSTAVAMGGLGHAAADDAYPLLARATDAVHVLAVGAWLGGLAIVAGAQWDAHGAPEVLLGQWRRFSRVATVAAPVVVLTGLVAAWRRLQLVPPSGAMVSLPTELRTALASDYGLLLLAKIALVLLAVALGYKHRRRVLNERAPSRPTVCAELLLAVVVFAITGVLTGTAPPGE